MNKQEQIKSELAELLGREPTCSKLKDGKYFPDYFKHGTKATHLIADTEDEAFEKLLVHLKSGKMPNQ